MAATTINCKYARNVNGEVHCFGIPKMPICRNMERCKLKIPLRQIPSFPFLSKKEKENLAAMLINLLETTNNPDTELLLNKTLTQLKNKEEL